MKIFKFVLIFLSTIVCSIAFAEEKTKVTLLNNSNHPITVAFQVCENSKNCQSSTLISDVELGSNQQKTLTVFVEDAGYFEVTKVEQFHETIAELDKDPSKNSCLLTTHSDVLNQGLALSVVDKKFTCKTIDLNKTK